MNRKSEMNLVFNEDTFKLVGKADYIPSGPYYVVDKDCSFDAMPIAKVRAFVQPYTSMNLANVQSKKALVDTFYQTDAIDRVKWFNKRTTTTPKTEGKTMGRKSALADGLEATNEKKFPRAGTKMEKLFKAVTSAGGTRQDLANMSGIPLRDVHERLIHLSKCGVRIDTQVAEDGTMFFRGEKVL